MGTPRPEDVVRHRPYAAPSARSLVGRGRSSEMPVDMVFTYVDGSDPAHAERRTRLAGCVSREDLDFDREPGKSQDLLFDNIGEITFSVRGALAQMPWLRTVFVVSDRQAPPIDQQLLDSGRVRVVDHAEILPAEYRPTFNSIAIESCLHRIRGLSEVFLYDNDDYFHFSAVPKESLLRENGGDGRVALSLAAYPAAVRRVKHLFRDGVTGGRLNTNAHTLGISNSFALLRSRYPQLRWHEILVPRHATHVIRRSTALRLERELEGALHRCRLQRFRTRRRLSYSTLLFTMERQWHPEDVVGGLSPFARARQFRVFEFRASMRPADSRRLWREVARCEARFACLNNMKPFEYDSFVAAMRAKGLGDPIARPAELVRPALAPQAVGL